MIARTIKKTVGSLSLLLAVAFGAVAPANAIVVSGSWDPLYGSPFLANPPTTSSNMWWSGTALFTIPDVGCTPTLANGWQVTCAGMYVSSATVSLSDGQAGPLVDTLNFAGQATLTKVQFTVGGGAIDWVESNWWTPLAQGSAPEYNLSNYLFSLSFSEAGANLFHTELDAYLDRHGGHGPAGRSLFWHGYGHGHEGDLCSPTNAPGDGNLCGFSDVPGAMVFAPIPEPSTYVLMFAGLAAVGFMARRRRQQPV